jgi:hypothetical protein
VHTQVDLLEKEKAAARRMWQSLETCGSLPAEVKAGAFYGYFNSGLG